MEASKNVLTTDSTTNLTTEDLQNLPTANLPTITTVMFNGIIRINVGSDFIKLLLAVFGSRIEFCTDYYSAVQKEEELQKKDYLARWYTKYTLPQNLNNGDKYNYALPQNLNNGDQYNLIYERKDEALRSAKAACEALDIKAAEEFKKTFSPQKSKRCNSYDKIYFLFDNILLVEEFKKSYDRFSEIIEDSENWKESQLYKKYIELTISTFLDSSDSIEKLQEYFEKENPLKFNYDALLKIVDLLKLCYDNIHLLKDDDNKKICENLRKACKVVDFALQKTQYIHHESEKYVTAKNNELLAKLDQQVSSPSESTMNHSDIINSNLNNLNNDRNNYRNNDDGRCAGIAGTILLIFGAICTINIITIVLPFSLLVASGTLLVLWPQQPRPSTRIDTSESPEPEYVQHGQHDNIDR